MESSEFPLRQIVYLDHPFVTELLPQLEGGAYDSEIRTIEQKRSRSLKGEVGAPVFSAMVKGGVGGEKSNREEIQRTIERTDAVKFAQFYNLLMAEGKIQELVAVDDDIWEQLQPNEFVDIQATIAPSTVAKTIDVVLTGAERLATIWANFGYNAAIAPSPREPSTKQDELAIVAPSKLGETQRKPGRLMSLIVGLLAYAGVIKGLPKLMIVAGLIGSPDYKFVGQLNRQHLAVTSLAELAGEMKIFGTLQRKHAERYPIGGMSLRVVEKLRASIDDEILAETLAETASQLYVEPPVCLFRPIAIYT